MVSTRRVVTWTVNGKSVIVSDGPAPIAHLSWHSRVQ
jgi:hypothetical protein